MGFNRLDGDLVRADASSRTSEGCEEYPSYLRTTQADLGIKLLKL